MVFAYALTNSMISELCKNEAKKQKSHEARKQRSCVYTSTTVCCIRLQQICDFRFICGRTDLVYEPILDRCPKLSRVRHRPHERSCIVSGHVLFVPCIVWGPLYIHCIYIDTLAMFYCLMFFIDFSKILRARAKSHTRAPNPPNPRN